jgi:hypothetical protein
MDKKSITFMVIFAVISSFIFLTMGYKMKEINTEKDPYTVLENSRREKSKYLPDEFELMERAALFLNYVLYSADGPDGVFGFFSKTAFPSDMLTILPSAEYYTIENTSISDKRGTVMVKFTQPQDEDGIVILDFVVEDGEWRISSIREDD